MPAEKLISNDYTAKNQEHFRNAQRGSLSRPLELTNTADFLHKRIVSTFNLPDTHKPILTWSVVFDKPKSPSSAYVYAERFPEDIKKEDEHDFSIGIGRITEYVTNFATKDFIRKNTNIPVLNYLAQAYAEFGDVATYGLVLGGTYREMARIEYVAIQNNKDFKQALYKGLFEHNTAPLDELVKDTEKFSGCLDTNDLAIKLGRKRFKKPDLGKWLNKLEVERTDGPIKGGIKNCAASVLAGGVFRSPGITEISAGLIPLFFAETLALYELNGKIDDIDLIAKNLAVVTAVGVVISPFAAIHEIIHGYSASKDHMGFIPAKLIEKEVTPYFTRLETEK